MEKDQVIWNDKEIETNLKDFVLIQEFLKNNCEKNSI